MSEKPKQRSDLVLFGVLLVLFGVISISTATIVYVSFGALAGGLVLLTIGIGDDP